MNIFEESCSNLKFFQGCERKPHILSFDEQWDSDALHSSLWFFAKLSNTLLKLKVAISISYLAKVLQFFLFAVKS